MSARLGISLPESWSWRPLKFLTTYLNRGTAPDYVEDGPIRAVSQAVNQSKGLAWERARFHFHQGSPRRLKGYLLPRDVLINSTGTGTLGRVGYFVESPDRRPCIADGHVTVARADRQVLEPRFLYYWLGSTPFYDYIYSALTVGATNQIELSREGLAAAPAIVPPLDEQRRIADLLDAETAQIDQLAELRNRQLKSIYEREIAAIVHAICGIAHGVSMHCSGLDWLGEVAEGFRVAAVSHEFEVALGKMLNAERTEGGFLRSYLRNINVQWDRVDVDDLLQMNFPPGERARYRVLAGDLLVCEGGDPGRAAIWDGSITEIYYQKALHRVRPRGESSVRWLYYCLKAAHYFNVFAIQGNVTTIAHLTAEQLKSQRFPFPPREVQDRIVKMLDERAEHQAQVEKMLNRQLALLTERRQALITAAVTGKIDVTTARGVEV